MAESKRADRVVQKLAARPVRLLPGVGPARFIEIYLRPGVLVAKSKGSRPDAQAEIPFAGFTELEWLSAVSLMEGQRAATGKIRSLFGDIRLRGSNGWAVSRSSWALLSLVNDDCKERVRDAIRGYPREFQRDVWHSANAIIGR